jgi:hypothetical protein
VAIDFVQQPVGAFDAVTGILVGDLYKTDTLGGFNQATIGGQRRAVKGPFNLAEVVGVFKGLQQVDGVCIHILREHVNRGNDVLAPGDRIDEGPVLNTELILVLRFVEQQVERDDLGLAAVVDDAFVNAAGQG